MLQSSFQKTGSWQVNFVTSYIVKGAYARIVVPEELRKVVGKSELRKTLGADRRAAVNKLSSVVAEMQRTLMQARQTRGLPPAPGIATHPMSLEEIALSYYRQRMEADTQLRNDPRYASIPINDLFVSNLKEAIAGRLSDADLAQLIGYEVECFRASGNLTALQGSNEWKPVARTICMAELEALQRVFERDEGDFSGEVTSPVLKTALVAEEAPATSAWFSYGTITSRAGCVPDLCEIGGGRRQKPIIPNLREFLKHDDAARVTRQDLLEWRDGLMTDLDAKTVNDIYLSTIRSLFAWAHENARLTDNVAKGVRQRKPKKSYGRERGYTDGEALAVLEAARKYQPSPDAAGFIREKQRSIDMKRWVPLLCAFTGARVSEITQLRKEDVRLVDDRWVARITPDAGTVKAGGYRDVPLHPQIIEESFERFVTDADQGPLFHNATEPEKYKRAAQIVSNKISEWLRKSGICPSGVQPNHAWSHRFKTQCIKLGFAARVVDAIQGHAGRTASDNFGNVTLKAKIAAIEVLLRYELAP